MCFGQTYKPVFEDTDFVKNIVVNINLKTEDLLLLKLRLRNRMDATNLALIVAELILIYLMGDDWNSEGRRELRFGFSIALLRCESSALSAIN